MATDTLSASVIPSRRAGVLGVHSLDHFVLHVPDLAVAQGFYGAFGLEVAREAGRLALRTAGHARPWAWIQEGARKALGQLAFGVFADDLPAFAQRLARGGVAQVEPPAGTEGDGLWFKDLDGLLLALRAAPVRSAFVPPAADTPLVHGARTAPFRGEAAIVKPSRLAHVMVFVRDVHASIRFYCEVLGLRLSDEVGGRVAFLHAPHGSDHHVLALLKSEGPGLHHCSWDVGAFHEVGQGAMQMAERGWRAGWGLGRFVLGSNYFHYVRDPWGSYCEYVSHVDYIPAGMDWQGRSHTPQRAFYLWGPEPPADFSVNHELAPASLQT